MKEMDSFCLRKGEKNTYKTKDLLLSISEIVEYCKNIEKRTKKRFFYTITTNGILLLNKEIEEYLIS